MSLELFVNVEYDLSLHVVVAHHHKLQEGQRKRATTREMNFPPELERITKPLSGRDPMDESLDGNVVEAALCQVNRRCHMLEEPEPVWVCALNRNPGVSIRTAFRSPGAEHSLVIARQHEH